MSGQTCRHFYTVSWSDEDGGQPHCACSQCGAVFAGYWPTEDSVRMAVVPAESVPTDDELAAMGEVLALAIGSYEHPIGEPESFDTLRAYLERRR